MRSEITSLDQFRSVLLHLLDRAKRNLIEDDDLRCTALLRHTGGMQQMFGFNLSIDEMAGAVRERVAEQRDVEYVMFIGLVRIRDDGDKECSYTVVRRYSEFMGAGKGPTAMAILIEGSHRDFGEQAAHIPFSRIGERNYSFGEPCTGHMKSSRTLAGLWPKRRLNS